MTLELDNGGAPITDPTSPDPARAVARVRARREAGDDGPRMVRDRKTGKMRPERRPGPKAKRARAQEPDDIESDESAPGPGEIENAAALCQAVWGLAGPMFGCRQITGAEAMELGRAAAPVISKYLPLYDEWGAEIAFALAVYGMVQRTRARPIREIEAEEHPQTATGTDAIDPIASGTTPVVR